MNKSLDISVLFALVMLLGISCTDKPIYTEFHKFQDDIWTYADTASFEFEISDTEKSYNLYLDVEHLESYPFQNLYLNIHSIYPGDSIVTEQLSLELQENSGYWTGDCSGALCKIRFILREGLQFRAPGSYGIRLEQHNRTDSLQGIRKAAIVLEFAE
jgi:gliding motility-associated lipoprotein GldH